MATELTTPDFAQIYAQFSSSLDVGGLPRSVIASAKRNVFDTLACSIAGFSAPGVQEVLDIVRDWGGKQEAQVLWCDARVPAPNAAWINGIMCHARDYDDTHDQAILHGGTSVVPAALAAAGLAGRPVSGKDFYAAVVSGLELICRLGIATRIGIVEAGFIYSSLFSYFAAAVAAARILRMSPAETVDALGIVFSQAAGTHQVTRDGAMTKRMQPGFGARAALTAVAMARKGIRGVQRTFEGEDGLGRIYLQSTLDAKLLREGLGERFHFQDLSYKAYPCGRMLHAAIEAARLLRGQPGFDHTKVREVRVYTNAQANSAVGSPIEIRRAPSTVEQAQFSLCYAVACALVNGSVGLADFTLEAIMRADVRSLCARVTPLVDDEIERRWSRGISPARVEVVTEAKTFSAHADEGKGGIRSPLSSEDIRCKLEDCLAFGGFHARQANFFEDAVEALDQSADIAADVKRLIAGVAMS